MKVVAVQNFLVKEMLGNLEKGGMIPAYLTASKLHQVLTQMILPLKSI